MTRTLVGAADPPERSEKRTERPPLNGVREAPFTLRSDDGEESDGLTLDGYGAVFNRLTAIDSWEGRFREQIAPGAMNRSFRETPPIVQFDHGRSSPIGSIPIAKVERIAEESDPVLAPEGGAHIVARLFDNWLVQPVRDAIAAGAISGMSFRFSVVREAWAYADGSPIRSEDALREELRRTAIEGVPDDELPIRTLKELRVPEMGPVVWPAYAETSVGIRSQVIDLGRLDDPEQRKLLARAVFIVDTAQSEETDAQQDTAPVAAVKHPPASDDAQRSTSGPVGPSVGEHPSTPRRLSSHQLRLMNQRDRLLHLRTIGERSR